MRTLRRSRRALAPGAVGRRSALPWRVTHQRRRRRSPRRWGPARSTPTTWASSRPSSSRRSPATRPSSSRSGSSAATSTWRSCRPSSSPRSTRTGSPRPPRRRSRPRSGRGTRCRGGLRTPRRSRPPSLNRSGCGSIDGPRRSRARTRPRRRKPSRRSASWRRGCSSSSWPPRATFAPGRSWQTRASVSRSSCDFRSRASRSLACSLGPGPPRSRPARPAWKARQPPASS
mmetsp:Transcript_39693/g.122727  ORF Transcript_39693/g.122727 Transcript_39693/m.122727 type:complete len:230 (+) Transcript_39693:178-867(+)